MVRELSIADIRNSGFDWPKYPLVEQYCVVQNGTVDVDKTIHDMQQSRAFYRQQLTAAFNFKMQTGADYSDFTDRHDEYVQMERELAAAIAHLEKIVEALEP